MRILSFLFSLMFYSSTSAQLVEGTIMFVGFNADGTDGFAIVSLIDIPASFTIYFSDNEWNGSVIGLGGAFINTTEGEITWSTGGSVVPAGTVVNFNSTSDDADLNYGASVGSISGEINLNAADEVLYAYLGSDDVTPTKFLSAITNSGFTLSDGTLLGTGLIDLVSATTILGDPDVMVYTGLSICNSTVNACAALIGLPINWTTDDGAGDQSNDGNAPDFPSDVPPSFSGSALPIELHLFEISSTIDNYILIKWITLSEVNNDYFTIEKSTDLINWQIVSRIKGAGNSVVTQEYTHLDINSPEKTKYYRLKQTDFDGKFSYSTIETIEIDATQTIKLYPNPSKGIFYFPSTIIDLDEIRVFSIIGEDITGQINIQNLSTETKIDLSFQSNGIYFLRLKDQFHRIVKY